jgi:hypothetical protein
MFLFDGADGSELSGIRSLGTPQQPWELTNSHLTWLDKDRSGSLLDLCGTSRSQAVALAALCWGLSIRPAVLIQGDPYQLPDVESTSGPQDITTVLSSKKFCR